MSDEKEKLTYKDLPDYKDNVDHFPDDEFDEEYLDSLYEDDDDHIFDDNIRVGDDVVILENVVASKFHFGDSPMLFEAGPEEYPERGDRATVEKVYHEWKNKGLCRIKFNGGYYVDIDQSKIKKI